MKERMPNMPTTRNPEIPTSLKKAIELQTEGIPTHFEEVTPPLSEEEYQELREQILSEIERECDKNAYHNRAHTEGVERRFIEMAKRSGFSPAEVQIGGIIALFHDFGHAGQTTRQETQESVPRKDLSNEEYAACKAGELLAGKVSQEIITFVQSGILSTTFGQTSGPHARPYKPHNHIEELVAFADIANITASVDAWIEDGFDVLSEMPREHIPKSYDDVTVWRNNFLNYIETKLENVAPILGTEATTHYTERLQGLREAVNSDEIKKKYESRYLALLEEKKLLH